MLNAIRRRIARGLLWLVEPALDAKIDREIRRPLGRLFRSERRRQEVADAVRVRRLRADLLK